MGRALILLFLLAACDEVTGIRSTPGSAYCTITPEHVITETCIVSHVEVGDLHIPIYGDCPRTIPESRVVTVEAADRSWQIEVAQTENEVWCRSAADPVRVTWGMRGETPTVIHVEPLRRESCAARCHGRLW